MEQIRQANRGAAAGAARRRWPRRRSRDLAALDDAAFRALFPRSPVKRLGRDRFLRNVLIAIGNSGDASLLPAVVARIADEAPLVRAMAVWALRRLAGRDMVEALRTTRLPGEPEAAVREEWIVPRP